MKLFEIKELSPTPRNFVAKHARGKTGGGAHKPKTGEKASRARRKRNWKKDIRNQY